MTRPRRSAASWTRSACPPRTDPGRPGRAGRAVPQPAGRPADAGRAGQRPRRRPGPAAAARRAGLPGPGDQPQPAHRPGRRRRAPTRSPLDLLSAGEARRPAGPPARRRPGRRRAGGGRRDHRARAPRLPLALAIVAARAATDPEFPLAALAAELRDTARPPRRAATTGDAGDRRAGGVLLVLPSAEPPARRGCSGCSACTPARTSRAPAAASLAGPPAAGCGRCWPSWPGRHLVDRADARPVRPARPAARVRRRLAARPSTRTPSARAAGAGCSTTTCTPRTRRTTCSTRTDGPPGGGPQPEPGVTVGRPPTTTGRLDWFTAEHRSCSPPLDQAAGTGSRPACLAAGLAAQHLPATARGTGTNWPPHTRTALAAARRLRDRRRRPRAPRPGHALYAGLAAATSARGALHRALDALPRARRRRRPGAHSPGAGAGYLARRPARRRSNETGGPRDSTGRPATASGRPRPSTTLGWHARPARRVPAALRCCRQALPCTSGPATGTARPCLDSLGYAHHGRGEHAQAADRYRKPSRCTGSSATGTTRRRCWTTSATAGAPPVTSPARARRGARRS